MQHFTKQRASVVNKIMNFKTVTLAGYTATDIKCVYKNKRPVFNDSKFPVWIRCFTKVLKNKVLMNFK